MEIILSNAINTPIYEQMVAQIKNQIIAGRLKADEPLPSIRSLAKDLKISVLTTKKAYDILESEGYIHTVHGKGSFVAEKNTAILRESRLREMENHMEKIVSLAPACQLTREELVEMFRIYVEENGYE